MTPKMLTQTAMGSFLINQTVEERRKIFKSSYKEKKVPDMSASQALKTRKKTKPGRKAMLEDGRSVKKIPGKVTSLTKNFEKKHYSHKTMLEPDQEQNKGNNTTLFRQIPGSTEPSSSHPDPEMALQYVQSAQPMAQQLSSHVTQYRCL